MLKHTVEDYLKTIFSINEKQQDKDKGIHPVDIANYLKVKKSSVSAAIQKLSKEGFVTVEPYSPVFLTEKGLKEAHCITHNHRVIEYFLKEILRCDTSSIHEEAHKLEHAFSESTIRKLDTFLGNPKISPHGKKIH